MNKGREKIEWVKRNMPVLSEIKERFKEKKPLEGHKIGMALHVEPKTANLVETLRDGGAEIAITGCNPLSTQDDVSKYLDNEKGIRSYAKRGVNTEEYYEAIDNVLDFHPDITIDDGADLVFRLHSERPNQIDEIIGGSEETTTGVKRLESMESDNALKYPIIAVNDTPMKRHFDNVHGTGESTLSAIMATTNLQISGKNIVVAGYGYCSSGVAKKAKALGARVTVTEVKPRKALEAVMDGYEVKKMEKAIQKADIVVTATGNKNVIGREELKKINNGAVLANSGHFNVEIDLEAAEDLANNVKEIREGIKKYELSDDRNFYVLAEGRLVNLAAPLGFGHPIEVMDLSFSIQALSVQHLAKNPELQPGVKKVPQKIDEKVAEIKLKTMDIEIDELTSEQKDYLTSWKSGT
ncbi:MAG: S-adenosylhomocysteine hydrolase [Candidatus Methanohalarchaeum thermophilum]|uniref:Adenosylhomocysteinase n=1 Tax=Methanohalarchaeum thermophilum TaxID=1903181 RepID=A0A1Q6DXT5_METT1|nr:MAG: S-adenosylhomocysteine hydrolase [Candidatus Methanohalarchaeum thermophilum]